MPGKFRWRQSRLSARCAVLALGVFGILLVVAVLATQRERTERLFEDVTPFSGIAYTGVTYGAAWGDFDGDGRPDLYVTNHLNPAQLFRNMGGGKFLDVSGEFFAAADLAGDKHGAAWADFNNDGSVDLVQLTGAARGVGTEAKRLFVNRGGRFEDVGTLSGIANLLGRARNPLWLDLDGDGRLDLLQGAERRLDDKSAPLLFLQRDGKFVVGDEFLKFASPTVPFCIIADLINNARAELVCRVSASKLAGQVFDVAALPARELELLPPTAFDDVAAGDFDNDGKIDLFLARRNPPGQIVFSQPGLGEIFADIWIDKTNVDRKVGFTFRSRGEVRFRVTSVPFPEVLSPEHVHIGSTGRHPAGMSFAISPETAGIAGDPGYQPGSAAGVYVSMTSPEQWQVLVSGIREMTRGGKRGNLQVSVQVLSEEAISAVEAIGEPTSAEEAPSRLLMNRGGRLTDESDESGVNRRAIAGTNVVSGDFDNDMHLDLFVLGSKEIGKQESLLLLNRGNGRFDVVRDAGGAAGGRAGVGDSVTTADFDGDGFLDLLVATGESMGRSEGPVSESGTYRLYRNIGNRNHWIEIDLQGTKSNRDGIGARVEVAAGGVAQVRVQDGGIHNRGQNHQRLHFGLGVHDRVQKLKIFWPSGTVQEMHDVAADRVIRIVEPSKEN